MQNNEITIVYPPTVDYNFLYQRPHQMMRAFSELGVNSIYVNPAMAFPQTEQVRVPFPELPNFKVIRWDADYRSHIKGKSVYWVSYGDHHMLKDFHRPDLFVYDSIDKATDEFSHWANWIRIMEAKSDLVFASAKAMYGDHSSRRKDVHMLPNGADYEHFSKAVDRLGKPTDLPDTNGKPLIGYYGAMATWLDMDIVYKIAEKYHVVMIGANQWYNIPVRNDNITVLPHKNYSDLPNYLSWFDVAIVPFKLTSMIEGCDPIKAWEYLAAGKPVVASNMVELQQYKDVYYFVNKDNADQVVERALRENSPEKIKQRQWLAAKNSWVARAEFALEKIREKLK